MWISRYWRCPTCAKLSRPANFENTIKNATLFEAGVQSSQGNASFKWKFEPLQPQEAKRLGEVLRTVSARFQDHIDSRLTDPKLPRDEFDALASAYIENAEAALDMAKADLASRKREVRDLLQSRGKQHARRSSG
jgi:hypothetical protein